MCTSRDEGGETEPFPCAEGLARYQEAVSTGVVTLAEVPRCLVDLRLLVELPGSPDRYAAVPPAAAMARAVRPLEEEISRRRYEIEAAREAFGAFESAYAATRADRAPYLTTLSGADVIDSVVAQTVRDSAEEVLTVQPGGGRAPERLVAELPRDLAALANGVRHRTVYQHSARSHPPTLAYMRGVIAAGGEIRTTSEIFDRLIVCDRRVAFIPVDDQHTAAALEIRHPAVVQFLVRTFHHIWERATPVEAGTARPRPEGVVAEMQGRVLRLLVEGHTDASMASRLGISTRTVAEYVHRASRRLGSASRAQLGYLLALREREAATEGEPVG